MALRWVELREPGKVPQRKGPFIEPGHLKKFLIEVFDARPSALVTVVWMGSTGPEFSDGPEYLEILDGRQSRRAQRHRDSTKAAWAAR